MVLVRNKQVNTFFWTLLCVSSGVKTTIIMDFQLQSLLFLLSVLS